MGWDGIEIKDGQSEVEAIIEFVESSHKDTNCIAYSYDDETGVYYLALKNKNDVYAEIASTRSFKGEVEAGWVHVKFISEYATPIYCNPSKEVFDALTYPDGNYNYEWRKNVAEEKSYKE